MTTTCTYVGPQGETCQELAVHSEFCFWHFEEKRKSHPELKAMLEERAKTGEPMIGFCLRGTDLDHVNLVNYSVEGYQLRHADLYRANLESAHLFSLDLTGTSLMKANLSRANFHRAILTDVNLLGTNLEGARIDNVVWSEKVLQEQQVDSATSMAQKLDYLEQAEEIYRNLRKVTEMAGLFENAGYFFQREMVMRRNQMPLFSLRRLFSKIVDLFCGYGERPARVVAFSLINIFGFVSLFWWVTVANGEVGYHPGAGWAHNIEHYLSCVYYSVVTFTTLGYGDITPQGFAARFFAATEAFVGSFMLALFVVVFVKKMTR